MQRFLRRKYQQKPHRRDDITGKPKETIQSRHLPPPFKKAVRWLAKVEQAGASIYGARKNVAIHIGYLPVMRKEVWVHRPQGRLTLPAVMSFHARDHLG